MYPPPLPLEEATFQGYTTIVWGTDAFAANEFAGYIVVSIRDSQRVELPIIENGSGLTATQVILVDGEDYEIEVVELTNPFNPPAAGTVVSLVSPYFADSQTFLVVNSHTQFGRKVEGHRTIIAKSYKLFRPQP